MTRRAKAGLDRAERPRLRRAVAVAVALTVISGACTAKAREIEVQAEGQAVVPYTQLQLVLTARGHGRSARDAYARSAVQVQPMIAALESFDAAVVRMWPDGRSLTCSPSGDLCSASVNYDVSIRDLDRVRDVLKTMVEAAPDAGSLGAITLEPGDLREARLEAITDGMRAARAKATEAVASEGRPLGAISFIREITEERPAWPHFRGQMSSTQAGVAEVAAFTDEWIKAKQTLVRVRLGFGSPKPLTRHEVVVDGRAHVRYAAMTMSLGVNVRESSEGRANGVATSEAARLIAALRRHGVSPADIAQTESSVVCPDADGGCLAIRRYRVRLRALGFLSETLRALVAAAPRTGSWGWFGLEAGDVNTSRNEARTDGIALARAEARAIGRGVEHALDRVLDVEETERLEPWSPSLTPPPTFDEGGVSDVVRYVTMAEPQQLVRLRVVFEVR